MSECNDDDIGQSLSARLQQLGVDVATFSEGMGRDSAKHETLLTSARQLWRQAAAANVISSSDIAEDLVAGDLRFVLLDYWMAKLCSLQNDMDKRRNSLQSAMSHVEDFLGRCRRLEILDDRDEEQWMADESTLDASQKREQKIARFRRQKESKEKMEESNAKLDAINAKRNAGAVLTPDETDEEDDASRDLVLQEIQQSIIAALELKQSCKMEIPMLEMRERMGEGQSRPRVPPPVSNRPVNGGPGKKSFSMVQIDQDSIRRMAFLPRNQPTMSIEEWGEIEMKMQREEAEKAKQIAQERAAAESLLSADEKEEIQRVKDSKWDDWKDENPRGAGNKGANIG